MANTASKTTTSVYMPVAEVVAKLGDKEFAAPYVVQVNKGSASNPRFLDVIEWHTAIRMLAEVFGPFGFDLEISGSTTDYANGIYTVDMKLTGRAIAEDGSVVSLTRPGRGLGLVPRSAINSDAEHDRQAHGAKSDAITNATKALGDGFGLYLYQRKPASQSQSASRPAAGSSATASYAPAGSNGSDELGPRPSAGQMKVLEKAGYPASFVATLKFGDWKDIVNALLNKDEDGNYAPLTPKIAPPAKSGARQTVGAGASTAEEPEEIPF